MRAAPGAAFPSVPWRRSNRLALSVLLVVGLAVLLTGYWGASGTQRFSRQVVWVNVAAAGLMIAGVGIVLFLAAGRRAVGRRRLALFGDVAVTATAVAGAAGGLVTAANMTRYHRADCSFVADKAVTSSSAAAHERAGRRPCGVCLGVAGDPAAGGESA